MTMEDIAKLNVCPDPECRAGRVTRAGLIASISIVIALSAIVIGVVREQAKDSSMMRDKHYEALVGTNRASTEANTSWNRAQEERLRRMETEHAVLKARLDGIDGKLADLKSQNAEILKRLKVIP